MGLLSRYSLVEGKESTESYSVHSVLHRWCDYLVEGEERCELDCLAAELVAPSVHLESEAEFWTERKRIMAHALCISEWIVSASRLDEEGAAEGLIQPGSFHMLGYLLDDEDRQQAEQMYQRALAGYTTAIDPSNRLTFIPALNIMWYLASLRKSQGGVEDARYWYSQALLGYGKTYGQIHRKCQALRDNLEALVIEEEEEKGGGGLDASTNKSLVMDHTSMQSEFDSGTSATKPASKRDRLLRKLRWK